MPRTPDRVPGSSEEEATLYEATGVATQQGEVRYTGTRFSMEDSTGEFDPRSGSGISEAQHETLDTLVHRIAEDAYVEIIRAAGRVTDIVVWTDSGKTVKIRETNITRAAGLVSQTVEKQYDGAGTLITGQTITSTFNRTGSNVSSIDQVET